MALLEFVFKDVWHFFGCMAILIVVASIFARRPNVTNLYEVPLEYWKDMKKPDAEEKNRDPDEVRAQAEKDMWKRDV